MVAQLEAQLQQAVDDHLALRGVPTEERSTRSTMDPQLQAQLQQAVNAHLELKGVPVEERPLVIFQSEDDLIGDFLDQVASIEQRYKLARGTTPLVLQLQEITATFRTRNDHKPSDSNDASDALVVTRKALRQAFNEPFLGDAHLRLETYLLDCWQQYHTKNSTYPFPYVAIVQSSGFGKSRVIQALAHKCSEDRPTTMNVLYVCIRSVESSTGFPPLTRSLKEYFFPLGENYHTIEEAAKELSHRLVAAFHYMTNRDTWNVVSEKLLRLFDGSEKDDQDLATMFREQKSRSSAAQTTSVRANTTEKVLVIAFDEARALLPVGAGVSWIRALRRALNVANGVISAEFGSGAGIFAILVDTSPKISNFDPSPSADSSQRLGKVRLFPPFVLTESVDIFFHEGAKLTRVSAAAKHMNAVRAALPSKGASWEWLRCMGRPLWMRGAAKDKLTLIQLAATKLLGGVGTVSPEAFKPENLHGVSSVLCRVGFRPSASSTLASRAVAEFMAALAYISFEHDQLICSYSSDPMLTLGAAYLWHRPRSTLAGKILPQLRQTLHQELMDTGGAGEMVARIVLLLAMDACAVLRTGDEKSRWEEAGEFSSVWTFLTALHGRAPSVRKPTVKNSEKKAKSASGTGSTTSGVVSSGVTLSAETKGGDTASGDTASGDSASGETASLTTATVVTPSIADTLSAVKSKWDDWYVSFTQFVQLSEEPTEACLWAMLGRRVAGALPPGQNGADFVIPIVKRGVTGGGLGSSVSMILVQVKNIENRDSVINKSATEYMDPDFVFENPQLREMKPHQMMRIYMSLRGYKKPATSYAVDMRSEGTTHTLCVCGFRAWSSQLDTTRPEVEVVSDAMVRELAPVLGPWRKVTETVARDVHQRDASDVFGRSVEVLMESATNTLVESLILNERETETASTNVENAATSFDMTCVGVVVMDMAEATGSSAAGDGDEEMKSVDVTSVEGPGGESSERAKLAGRQREADVGDDDGRSPKATRLA